MTHSQSPIPNRLPGRLIVGLRPLKARIALAGAKPGEIANGLDLLAKAVLFRTSGRVSKHLEANHEAAITSIHQPARILIVRDHV